MRSDLYRQAPGDIAHGRQQRQETRLFNCLERDRGQADEQCGGCNDRPPRPAGGSRVGAGVATDAGAGDAAAHDAGADDTDTQLAIRRAVASIGTGSRAARRRLASSSDGAAPAASDWSRGATPAEPGGEPADRSVEPPPEPAGPPAGPSRQRLRPGGDTSSSVFDLTTSITLGAADRPAEREPAEREPSTERVGALRRLIASASEPVQMPSKFRSR